MLREHAAVTTPRLGRSLCLPPIVRHPAVVTDPEDACPLAVGEGPGLLERLAILPALRARRGRRHTLASVLALSAAAVLAGARSVAGIAEWAADAPGPVLPRARG
jgi:DDE_Tnp_1-associated